MQATERSQQIFDLTQKVIPGGVNSPVRAFRSVGGTPRIIAKGEGAYLFDVDGRIASHFQKQYSEYHEYNV